MARTARQRAQLRQAQLASARKRRRRTIRRVAIGVGVVAGIGATAYTGHKLRGRRRPVTQRAVPTGVGPYSAANLAKQKKVVKGHKVRTGVKGIPRSGGPINGAYVPRPKKQYSGYYGAGG